MKKKNFKIYIAVFSITLLVASCKVTQTYTPPEVKQELQYELYRDVSTNDTTTLAHLPWQQLFPDAALQALIHKALANNFDLKIAVERINEATALYRQSGLAYLPSLNGSLSAGVNRSSRSNTNTGGFDINTTNTPVQLGVSASWEIDIWGKLKSAEKAALARLLQTDAAKRAVQTQIIANMASFYYQLLALDQNLAITQAAIAIRQEDVQTMKALKEAAIVTGAAVVQSEASLYAAQVSLPDIRRSIREIENMMSVLAGEAPETIARSSLDAQTIITDLKTGVPLQLLSNRPDVQVAEFAFRTAFENANIARASFYPNLNITAALGISSLRFENLFKNSPLFYNIGGNLTQVIFNRAALKTQLKVAESQQLQTLYAFQQSFLNAGKEVSDALYAYETGVEKQQTRSLQIASLQKAVEFNKELLKYSSATNYTDVLMSEQNLLQAQLAAVNDKLQQLQAVVELYQALGGGSN